jgi:hypothetical protein
VFALGVPNPHVQHRKAPTTTTTSLAPSSACVTVWVTDALRTLQASRLCTPLWATNWRLAASDELLAHKWASRVGNLLLELGRQRRVWGHWGHRVLAVVVVAPPNILSPLDLVVRWPGAWVPVPPLWTHQCVRWGGVPAGLMMESAKGRAE